MAGGDRCLRIRRSRALVDERRAEEDGEAHCEANSDGHDVREGSMGRVDGGGDVWREREVRVSGIRAKRNQDTNLELPMGAGEYCGDLGHVNDVDLRSGGRVRRWR